jgi:hypothetical protein
MARDTLREFVGILWDGYFRTANGRSGGRELRFTDCDVHQKLDKYK